jgi:uncharacterized protein (TIRG00374 family)
VLLGLAISAALLWWTLHDVALADVLEHARRARWGPLAAAVLVATLTFPLRTVRWRLLLNQDGAPLRFVPLWHATAIGFMANNLLPARAGEFARAYAARHLTGVRFSAAFGSVAVERALDGIILVALLGLAIGAGGLRRDTTVGGVSLEQVATVALAVFGTALLGALLVVHWPGPALRFVRGTLARVLSARATDGLMRILEGLLSGLDALKSGRRFGFATAWSVVVWATGAASYWLGFQAFSLDVPWTAALLLQSLVAFGVAIPSSPGFFGPFEAVTRATLSLYAVPAAAAVSAAVAYHLAAFVPISLLGLWSLARAQMHMGDLSRARAEGQEGQDGQRGQERQQGQDFRRDVGTG